MRAMHSPLALVFVLLAAQLAASQTNNNAADYAELTAGVASVTLPPTPSPLVLTGNALPIVVNAERHVLVAATRWGAGRVVVFGHEGCLDAGEGDGRAGLAALLGNAAAWAGGARGAAAPLRLAALSPEDAALAQKLAPLDSDRFQLVATAAPEGGVTAEWLAATADVVFGGSWAGKTAAELAAIRSFVSTGGGGLVTGGQAWSSGISAARIVADFPTNALVAPSGIAVSGAYSSDGTFDLSVAPAPQYNAQVALGGLLREPRRRRRRALLALSPEAQLIARVSVALAMDTLPAAGYASFWTAVATLAKNVALGGISGTTPMDIVSSAKNYLAVRYSSKQAQELPPAKLTAHPAAANFPGAVPAAAPPAGPVSVLVNSRYAGRASNYIYSDPEADLWVSTSVYARPGGLVTVTIPPAAARLGLKVSIGCHVDSLWGKESLLRMPEIVRVFPLTSPSTVAASAFGGLVFIRVPVNAAGLNKTWKVTVSGATVRAPRYVHGQTRLADWSATLRAAPAPWAELQTDNFVLTLPSAAVRGLADPGPLMARWKAVLDAEGDLAGVKRPRARRERMVLDVDISAGWMHSGYPVMAYTEVAADLTKISRLAKEGDWGAFHEFGHNHQWGGSVLPGTTETTCNLFSVYVMETLVGNKVGHEQVAPAALNSTVAAYIAGGRKFEEWSVWTALATYLQLKEAFGWGFYKSLNQQYQALQTQPQNDAERIQAWVVRSSKVAKVNLAPFYLSWGFPLTAETKAAVSSLPRWTKNPMPPVPQPRG